MYPSFGHAKSSPQRRARSAKAPYEVAKLDCSLDRVCLATSDVNSERRQVQSIVIRSDCRITADLGQQEIGAEGVRYMVPRAPVKQPPWLGDYCRRRNLVLAEDDTGKFKKTKQGEIHLRSTSPDSVKMSFSNISYMVEIYPVQECVAFFRSMLQGLPLDGRKQDGMWQNDALGISGRSRCQHQSDNVISIG